MVTAIVQFQVPNGMTREQVVAGFDEVAAEFQQVAGLLRKYFLLSRDGKVAGGVYLWRSAEDADAFYNAGFRDFIHARYGVEPSIMIYQTPIVVDNAANKIISDVPAPAVAPASSNGEAAPPEEPAPAKRGRRARAEKA